MTNNNTAAPKKETATNTATKNTKAPSHLQKKSKFRDQPKPFWFFILFGAGIVFSVIAWLGSISTDFPWLVLCGGCAVLAAAIGLWLWGYNSHKPEVKVKVKQVYICQPASQPEICNTSKNSSDFLTAIANDPDLVGEDEDSDSYEDED